MIKTGVAVIKDPGIVNQKLVELAKSDNPEIQVRIDRVGCESVEGSNDTCAFVY